MGYTYKYTWLRNQMETVSVLRSFVRETTSHRWIPLTKASDSDPWRFLWCSPEQTIEQNNRHGGDLGRHGAHCDVPLMIFGEYTVFTVDGFIN